VRSLSSGKDRHGVLPRTLIWDSPSSRAISCEILHDPPSIVAQLCYLRGLVFIQYLSDLPHGDAAPIVETHLRLDDVDQENVVPIPVQQCPLDYYRYRGLRACFIIRRVCIP
jgi:hypothetical protein